MPNFCPPTLFLHLRMRRCNAFGRVCVCVSVCLSLPALTFESIDPETLFWVRRYTLRMSRSSSYIEVIGSRSRSREQQCHTSLTKYTHSRVVHFRFKGSVVTTPVCSAQYSSDTFGHVIRQITRNHLIFISFNI